MRTQVSEPSTLTNPGPNAAHAFSPRAGGLSGVVRGAIEDRDCAIAGAVAAMAKTTINPGLSICGPPKDQGVAKGRPGLAKIPVWRAK